MITITADNPSPVNAELQQESLPYENSSMQYLKFVPIIGFIFFDIINTSINEYLLQKTPPPSLTRRLQIYRQQEMTFRHVNAVQCMYIFFIFNPFVALSPIPATTLFLAGIVIVEILGSSIKQELYRTKTVARFGDGASFFY